MSELKAACWVSEPTHERGWVSGQHCDTQLLPKVASAAGSGAWEAVLGRVNEGTPAMVETGVGLPDTPHITSNKENATHIELRRVRGGLRARPPGTRRGFASGQAFPGPKEAPLDGSAGNSDQPDR